MYISGPVVLVNVEKWYKRGMINKGDFRRLAVLYIEQGETDTDRYIRACEVDILADKWGI